MPLITSVLSSPLQASTKVYHPQRLDGKTQNLKRRVAFSSIHYGGNRGDCSTVTASTAASSMTSASAKSALHSVSEYGCLDDNSLSSVSMWTRPSNLGWGWGSVESRKSYQCLTTLNTDHCNPLDCQEGIMKKSLDEEMILCFRAKRMLICRDDVDGGVDTVVTASDSAAWGYFVDTVDE